MRTVILPILSVGELSAKAFDYARKEYEQCMGRAYSREEFDELAKEWAFLPNGMLYTPELERAALAS